MAKIYIGGGISRADMDKSGRFIVDKKFNPNTTIGLLESFVAEITEALTARLTELKKDQPGDLIQSIGEHSKVTTEGTKLVLKIALNDYWKYVDEGRRAGAKQPPQKAILDFINVNSEVKAWARTLINKKQVSKQIKKLNSKRIKKAVKQISVEKAYKQAAFLIGRSIKKKGIEPTHFFTDVVNAELKARLTSELSKSLLRDIEIEFTT